MLGVGIGPVNVAARLGRVTSQTLHRHLYKHISAHTIHNTHTTHATHTTPSTHLRLREQYPSVTCVTLACPGCMTLELAQSCAGYVTTVINGTDLVPCMSPAAADALREEVMQSSWCEGGVD